MKALHAFLHDKPFFAGWASLALSKRPWCSI